jgi:microcystin degradation protein MlrC
MLDREIADACFGALYDPGAVTLCHAPGAGARLRIGGKFSPASGDPLDVDAEVLNITDRLMMLKAFGGPDSVPLGPAAAIRVGGVDIALTSRRQQALGDLFADLGLNWRAKRFVALKSSQHFYVVFGPDAAEVLDVDSPGSVTSDWSQRPYVHRPRPLWPLDAD